MSLRTVSSARSLAACAMLAGGALAAGGCGGEEKLTQAQIIENGSASTVRIITKGSLGTGGGTGVVIDAGQGLVLTNDHVVSGVGSIKAVFKGTEKAPARVVAHAPCEDLAMLKLNAPLPGARSIALGSSKALVRGQHLTALGFPGDINSGKVQSRKIVPTEGSVSVPDQSATPGDSYPSLPSVILHQATINHGNSGGPLVNDKAQLVGINTLSNPDAQDQYYSIGIDHVKPLLADLKAGKNRDYVGWDLWPSSTISGKTVGVANRLGYTVYKRSLFIGGVDSGSPADRAELSTGDSIFEINDQDVKNVSDVCSVVQSHGKGDKVKLEGGSTGYPNGWKTTMKL